MKLRRASYLLHRWIGLLVSLQLLAWSSGGLYFAIVDIETVHGDPDARQLPPSAVDLGRIELSAVQAIERAAAAGMTAEEVATATLRGGFDGTPEYLLRSVEESYLARVNATTGEVSGRISEAEAIERARADFVHASPIASTKLFEDEVPSEARGRRPPLYQVVFDHPHGTRLYLDAVTGDVVARRNDAWRIFDWFWMLHIMDYDERESFNHPLLVIFAMLAVSTSVSGIALWLWRTVPRARRRWARAGG